MWNYIKSEADVISFMNTMCYFHDSCVKEIKYKSGAYVDDDYAMYPINDCRILNMVIQSQQRKLGMIELEFTGLKWMKLTPDENYTCEILDATLLLTDNCFYWCDCGGLSIDDVMKYDRIAVCASGLKWRKIENRMGNTDYYNIT